MMMMMGQNFFWNKPQNQLKYLRNYLDDDDDDDDGSELFLKLPINVCNFVQLQVTLLLCV